MGTLLTTSIMIKLLLGSALLALTAAEADPQLLYGAGLPYAAGGLPYVGATVGAVAHVPVVKSDVVTAAEVEHEVTAHAVPVAVGYHGLGHFGYYGKRSADAEPEADAYYGYYGYGGYGGYRGYHGYPYGHRYGYYGKRSADAEPAVLAGASRVITPPTPLIHNPPAIPVAYAHPVAYAGYAAHPTAYAGYAAHPLAYHGLPVLAAPAAAEEAVVAERKKREADPQVLLNGAVLPYSGLPYAAAPAVLAPVGAVAHAPVVKSVVEKPAEVTHEVTAHAVPVAVGYHGLPYWG